MSRCCASILGELFKISSSLLALDPVLDRDQPCDHTMLQMKLHHRALRRSAGAQAESRLHVPHLRLPKPEAPLRRPFLYSDFLPYLPVVLVSGMRQRRQAARWLPCGDTCKYHSKSFGCALMRMPQDCTMQAQQPLASIGTLPCLLDRS